jgi:hypothetical protein
MFPLHSKQIIKQAELAICSCLDHTEKASTQREAVAKVLGITGRQVAKIDGFAVQRQAFAPQTREMSMIVHPFIFNLFGSLSRHHGIEFSLRR